jgi:hypothetical protein
MPNYNDEDDLYDPFEGGAGGNYRPPVVSWKYARSGAVFEGIVIPPNLDRIDKGYVMGRDFKQKGSDESDPDDEGPTVWPPKPNVQGIKRPVTERKYVQLWGEPSRDDRDRPEWQKVSQTNVWFLTEYTDGEMISDSASRKMIDREKDPKAEALRRVITDSSSILKAASLAALKAVGAKSPTPGQKWRVILTGRTENVGKPGTTSQFEVTITAPTTETKAVVAAYVEKAKAEAGAKADAADPDDPWATGAGATGIQANEVPF